MKPNFIKLKRKINKTLFISIATLFAFWNAPIEVFGQGGVKITSLAEVESKAKEGSDAMTNIAKYVIAAALAIGLLFVVYQIANNNPKAKEYGLAWIIAVVIVMIGYLII